MIINQQKYVLSEWDEEAQCYINTWFGAVKEEQFKEAVLIGKDYIIKNNVKVHLADTTKMKTGWYGSEEWLFSNFWKDVPQAGLTHFGIVLSENIFMEFASTKMERKLQEIGVEVVYEAFKTIEEAKVWSKQVQGI